MKMKVLALLMLGIVTSISEARRAPPHRDLGFLAPYGKISCPGHPRQVASGCVIETNPTLDGSCKSTLEAISAELQAHGYEVGLRQKDGDFFDGDSTCYDGLYGYYGKTYFSPAIDPCAGLNANGINLHNLKVAQMQRDFPSEPSVWGKTCP